MDTIRRMFLSVALGAVALVALIVAIAAIADYFESRSSKNKEVATVREVLTYLKEKHGLIAESCSLADAPAVRQSALVELNDAVITFHDIYNRTFTVDMNVYFFKSHSPELDELGSRLDRLNLPRKVSSKSCDAWERAMKMG